MDISCFLPKLLLTLSLCLPGMLGIGLDLEAKSYWLGLVLGVSGLSLKKSDLAGCSVLNLSRRLTRLSYIRPTMTTSTNDGRLSQRRQTTNDVDGRRRGWATTTM